MEGFIAVVVFLIVVRFLCMAIDKLEAKKKELYRKERERFKHEPNEGLGEE